MVKDLAFVTSENPRSLTAFRRRQLKGTSQVWVPLTYSSPLRGLGEGQRCNIMKLRSKRSSTLKEKQDVSVRPARGKDLEFLNVMISVQIIDLDWDMTPTAISL